MLANNGMWIVGEVWDALASETIYITHLNIKEILLNWGERIFIKCYRLIENTQAFARQTVATLEGKYGNWVWC